jgi:hypothetical protein
MFWRGPQCNSAIRYVAAAAWRFRELYCRTTYVAKHKCMQENTPRNSFYIFRQQGYLLHC